MSRVFLWIRASDGQWWRPSRLPGLGVSMRMERDPEIKMFRRIFIDISLPPDFREQYISAVVRAAENLAVTPLFSRRPKS